MSVGTFSYATAEKVNSRGYTSYLFTCSNYLLVISYKTLQPCHIRSAIQNAFDVMALKACKMHALQVYLTPVLHFHSLLFNNDM